MKRVINCGYKFEQRGNSYYMTSTSTHNTYKVDMEELDDNDISGYCTFQMAIVKPYDDADYAWAKYDGSTIMCFQKGKLVDYLGGLLNNISNEFKFMVPTQAINSFKVDYNWQFYRNYLLGYEYDPN